ncbi:FmdE family protein [Oleidesulfovibrio sp.]|uniref:FmdE family protein n=1 Tax=Oleidesulfovibrio sp. TaxID=2909707 RepID=UPI003A882236
MSCLIPGEVLDQVISFHGHSCPGLSIGVRAAELAIQKLGEPADIDMVAVVETDMCGVDAIQFLTGCTLGKGNLIHRDYGKMAFCFYDRISGNGFRALLKPNMREINRAAMTRLMKRQAEGVITEGEAETLKRLRNEIQDAYYAMPLDEMFIVSEWSMPPRKAVILESLQCECCGEYSMESRTRRFSGKVLCIPCFMKVEQKM